MRKQTFMVCYQWEVIGHPLNSEITLELEDREYSDIEIIKLLRKHLTTTRKGYIGILNFWK